MEKCSFVKHDPTTSNITLNVLARLQNSFWWKSDIYTCWCIVIEFSWLLILLLPQPVSSAENCHSLLLHLWPMVHPSRGNADSMNDSIGNLTILVTHNSHLSLQRFCLDIPVRTQKAHSKFYSQVSTLNSSDPCTLFYQSDQIWAHLSTSPPYSQTNAMTFSQPLIPKL